MKQVRNFRLLLGVFLRQVVAVVLLVVENCRPIVVTSWWRPTPFSLGIER
jgi:hypothetical protein